ncbi:MAG: gfo/Idh/MocA family oxidoreductase [Crocinitomicaceae bacterium]|jgi:predicted dehydrogenase|nr:gfo/Idh/MocA family oxidoreductase [Crocinitomicaceae bacterium]MBT5403517.1 gfo/Idh/MocA family oxidoreductase [Crocinitomicaceae bacterium]MBT6028862.1 gfo/Idh/MocA family oxidoreductase [Crocinitomicaceae bacterium]MBT6513314.1 gfo/Idh/MocA family oxidoreductase [Crocinitomicaceae bacterium]MDG2329978.1 hypothetical protein [Flavobacteriales bacterium]
MSHNIKSEPILLVGAGPMAIEYARILKDADVNYTVVGRGLNSANKFEKELGKTVVQGGIELYLQDQNEIPKIAIVALQVNQLAAITQLLLFHGVKKVLVEKPAGITKKEIEQLVHKEKFFQSKIFVAYNRRFLSSVQKAKELIVEDGGILSFNFEFTEWSHVIAPLSKPEGVKETWFYSNTTHVVDLAFFLGGAIKEMKSFVSRGLKWHPKGSVFSGAGITNNGALFSYHANWESAGRWGLELSTGKRKIILTPLEKVQIQNLGSIQVHEMEIDDTWDRKYKPGLYLQVYHFIMNDDCTDLLRIGSQLENFETIFEKILNDQ